MWEIPDAHGKFILLGLELSVCTKVQVDNCNSHEFMVPKIIVDLFTPNDLKLQGSYSIVNRPLT